MYEHYIPNLDRFVSPRMSGGHFESGLSLITVNDGGDGVIVALAHWPHTYGYDSSQALINRLGNMALELSNIDWFPLYCHGTFFEALMQLEAKLEKLDNSSKSAISDWSTRVAMLWNLALHRPVGESLFSDDDAMGSYLNVDNVNDEPWMKAEYR